MKKLILVLYFLVATLSQGADFPNHNEAKDFQRKRETGFGTAQVVAKMGATQAPIFFAFFGGLTNPNANLEISADALKYADFLWTCVQSNPYLNAYYNGPTMNDDKRAVARHSFKVYTSLMEAQLGSFPSIAYKINDHQGNEIADISDDCPLNGEYALRTSIALNATQLGRFLRHNNQEDFDGTILFWLDRRVMAGKGITLADLYLLFLMWIQDDLINTNRTSLVARYPLTKSPRSLFIAKTTPSLEHNYKLARIAATRIPWDELGMHHGYQYANDPVGTWIARFQYENPVLTSFVPIIGAAWDLTDAVISYHEGRDAHGAPQGKLLSAVLAGVHGFFLFMDLAPALSFTADKVLQFRERLKVARHADAPEALRPFIDEYEEVLRTFVIDTHDIGSEVVSVKTLGTPVPTYQTLGNRLRYSVEKAWEYGRNMEVYVDAASMGLTKRLNKVEMVTLDEVEDVLALGAQETAQLMGVSGWEIFGSRKSIIVPLESSLGSRFDDAMPLLRQYVEDGSALRPFDDTLSTFGQGIRYEGFNDTNLVGKVKRNSGFIGNVEIPASTVIVYDDPFYFLTSDGVKHVNGRIIWGSSEGTGLFDHSLDLLIHREQLVDFERLRLFNKIMDPKTPMKEVVGLTAELHWWSVNFPGFNRGNNGIMDALTKAIFKARGVKVGRWKANVSPDFYAVVMSKEQFRAYYPLLFEYKVPKALPGVPFFTKEIKNSAVDHFLRGSIKDQLVEVAGRNFIRGWASFAFRQNPWVPDFDNAQDSAFYDIPQNIAVTVSVQNVDGSLEKIGHSAANLDTDMEIPQFITDEIGDDLGFEIEIPEEHVGKPLIVKAIDVFIGAERTIGVLNGESGVLPLAIPVTADHPHAQRMVFPHRGDPVYGGTWRVPVPNNAWDQSKVRNVYPGPVEDYNLMEAYVAPAFYKYQIQVTGVTLDQSLLDPDTPQSAIDFGQNLCDSYNTTTEVFPKYRGPEGAPNGTGFAHDSPGQFYSAFNTQMGQNGSIDMWVGSNPNPVYLLRHYTAGGYTEEWTVAIGEALPGFYSTNPDRFVFYFQGDEDVTFNASNEADFSFFHGYYKQWDGAWQGGWMDAETYVDWVHTNWGAGNTNVCDMSNITVTVTPHTYAVPTQTYDYSGSVNEGFDDAILFCPDSLHGITHYNVVASAPDMFYADKPYSCEPYSRMFSEPNYDNGF